VDHLPAFALTDGIGPGQCWAFHGDSGQLGIQLAKAIRMSALTVGHTNMSSTASAPKGLVLWGLKDIDSDVCATFGGMGPPQLDLGSGLCGVRLLSGIYNPSNSQLYQNFTVDPSIPYYTKYFDNVIVQIVGNWGHPDFTCIYRVQIYGETY
jgi:Sad1 / UNC-like C-terminal